jgi:hypothetical protein
MRRYQMIYGPCDGAFFDVPKGNHTVCVAVGPTVHVYQLCRSRDKKRPMKALVHAGYMRKEKR